MFDQYYYAQRVRELGIGATGIEQLRVCLQPAVRDRAAALSRRIVGGGASRAAQSLLHPQR
ncbi:MAG TPA: hypothetical protein VFX59_24055 [Polyangiales bacterium]|nr:hypothetical protein [Polyangiales bacterium]